MFKSAYRGGSRARLINDGGLIPSYPTTLNSNSGVLEKGHLTLVDDSLSAAANNAAARSATQPDDHEPNFAVCRHRAPLEAETSKIRRDGRAVLVNKAVLAAVV